MLPTRPAASLLGILAILAIAPALCRAPIPPAGSGAAPVMPAGAGRGAMPTWFELNAGQADAAAGYVGRIPGGQVLFDRTGLRLSLCHATGAVAVRFHGAATTPVPASAAALPGRVNVLLGADPSAWRTNVPTYAGVSYPQLYPGIDLSYGGAGRGLEGTYTVAPQADPSMISWSYEGARAVTLDAEGNLQIRAQCSGSGARADGADTVATEHAPRAWQEVGGRRQPVAAGLRLAPDGGVSLALAAYDHARALTIDPTLVYSDLISGGDFVSTAISVDAAGDAYVTGSLESDGSGTSGAYRQHYRGGVEDAFVAKVNPTGSALVYATYLGGSGLDEGRGIAVDAGGDAYVTGFTASSDFPTFPTPPPGRPGSAYQTTCRTQCAFVTELNPSGRHLVYSTFLGDLTTEGHAIAIDAAGDAYVAGSTNDALFPTSNALQAVGGGLATSGFASELDPTGTALISSTFLGGGATANPDVTSVEGVGVDVSGDIWLTGATTAAGFPTTPNAFQAQHSGGSRTRNAFVTELTAGGAALGYSTLLGAGGGTGVALDPLGAAYVTSTSALAAKFAPNGGLVYYLHGNPGDSGNAIAVDVAGDAYVTGGGATLTKLSTSGSPPVYSYFLGNGYGTGVAVDAAGSAYITGNGAGIRSNPLLPDADGDGNSFLMKVDSPLGNPLCTPLTCPQPPPVVSIGSAGAAEPGPGGITFATFPLHLNKPAAVAVTVPFSMTDGSARAGINYMVPPVPQVLIPPNVTSMPLPVAIRDEGDNEGRAVVETFTVTLGKPTNAVLGVRAGTGSISDNDTVPPPPPPPPPPPLAVTGIRPVCGPTRGAPVGITGSNFNSLVTVRFDGVPVAGIADATGTAVSAIAPPHPGPASVPVTVENAGQTPVAAPVRYEYSDACQDATVVTNARTTALTLSTSSGGGGSAPAQGQAQQQSQAQSVSQTQVQAQTQAQAQAQAQPAMMVERQRELQIERETLDPLQSGLQSFRATALRLPGPDPTAALGWMAAMATMAAVLLWRCRSAAPVGAPCRGEDVPPRIARRRRHAR